jgi:hypothetical protein
MTTWNAFELLSQREGTRKDRRALFHPDKLRHGTPVWRRLLRNTADAISDVRILDTNYDRHRHIAVASASGTTRFTFDGSIIGTKGAERWEAGQRVRPASGG